MKFCQLKPTFAWWIVASAASLAGCAGVGTKGSKIIVHPDDSLGLYGSLLDVNEFNAAPQALPAAAMGIPTGFLPDTVTLQNLPSIATQGTPPNRLGSPGSCEAQSFAYGLCSYTAAMNPDGSMRWDASQPQNQISAAFQYRYQHHKEGKTCPSGSGALGYLDYIIANGSPSAADIPYKPDCTYLDGIPLNPKVTNPERFRVGSYATFQVSRDPDAAVQAIKEYVSGGHVVAFSGLVLQGYSAPTMTNGVITSTASVPGSGHGQIVVGYDEHAGPGALLVQNSFGPQWPPASSGSIAPPGMAYWSYDSFKATQKLCAIAFPRQLTNPGGVNLNQSQSRAPRGVINQAYQWAGDDMGPAYLILVAWFGEPLLIDSISMTEPSSGATMASGYGHHFGNGYLYFCRSDGRQFVSGTYALQIAGQTLSGTQVTYSANVAVGAASPGSPPASTITSTAQITGSTGQTATITR